MLKVVETQYQGFNAGDAVTHKQRNGHVICVPPSIIPNGEVPVMYDDEGGCFVSVPARDLVKRA